MGDKAGVAKTDVPLQPIPKKSRALLLLYYLKFDYLLGSALICHKHSTGTAAGVRWTGGHSSQEHPPGIEPIAHQLPVGTVMPIAKAAAVAVLQRVEKQL